MIKRNQSSMTLLNNVTTNTFISQTQFIQFQLRADTSRTDVNFIIVLIAVQLDLHAVIADERQPWTNYENNRN